MHESIYAKHEVVSVHASANLESGERVAGADLGMGQFQFDFEDAANITEVMKMEPFHFDHWILSMLRLLPVVDSRYPSVIMF